MGKVLWIGMVLVFILPVTSFAQEVTLPTDGASSLVESGQGILPESQPTEIIGLNLGVAEDDSGTLNSVTIVFEDAEGKGTFTISDLSRVSVYSDTSTTDTANEDKNGVFNLGEDTELGFVSNPTSLTVTIPVGVALPEGDEDTFEGNDFFIVIKTSSTISGGPINSDDDERDNFTARIDKGDINVTVTSDPAILSETELESTGTITCEAYSIDLTDLGARYSDYSTAYPVSVPGQDIRPRWDIEPETTQEVFIPASYLELLSLETPTSIIGVSLAGGTANNPEYLDSVTIKLQNVGSDTSFDPREGLDSNYLRKEISSGIWQSFFGIDIYEDLDTDSSFTLGIDSVVTSLDISSYIDKNGTINGSEGPWTLTFIRSGTDEEEIERTADGLIDYFVVVRADSGYNDESGIIGDDNPINFGADFQVELTTSSIGMRNAGDIPSSSGNALTLTTNPVNPVLEIHDLADYAKSIDATSEPVPIIGINVTDTSNTTTIAINDEVIQSIRVNFDFDETVTIDDFADLSTDETSGISLWKDNKSSGDIGVFDSLDTIVSISQPEWQTEGSIYYVILDPTASQEMPGDDLYIAENRGDDYFICVATSEDIRYRDGFPGNVSIRDGDIQFRTQTSAEGTSLTINPFSGTDLIEGRTVSVSGANVPVFLTDLTEENQTIPIPASGETGTKTAVLGINMIGDTTNNPELEEVVVEFYSKGSDTDFDPGLDLEELSLQDTSGVAIYKDTSGGEDGIFDSSDTFIVPDATPEFIGQTGEPFQVRIIFENNPQTIPTDDTTSGNTGPDYFVVIRLSDRANPGDDFSVGIVGWAGDQLQTGLRFRDNSNRVTRTYERLQTNSINTIPNAPTGLDVTSETNSVTFGWDESIESDLEGYNIYRKVLTEPDDTYTKLNSAVLTDATYTDVTPGPDEEKFEYAVTSVDRAGNESEKSDTVVILANEEGGGKGGGGGGCFIATAAYGSPYAEEVIMLCKFRDETLLTNPAGRAFVQLYYKFSPKIADFISQREYMKKLVRKGLSLNFRRMCLSPNSRARLQPCGL